MKISNSSWHYKVYSWTYTFFGSRPPQQSNLCQYVRRLILGPSLCIGVGAIGGISFLVLLPFLIVRSIVGFLFGYTTDLYGLTLHKYQGLSVKGFQIYPGYILAPIALIVLNYYLVRHWPAPYSVVSIAMELTISMVALVVGLIVFFSSDSFSLARHYIDAKTQGICPLVEFDKEKK